MMTNSPLLPNKKKQKTVALLLPRNDMTLAHNAAQNHGAAQRDPCNHDDRQRSTRHRNQTWQHPWLAMDQNLTTFHLDDGSGLLFVGVVSLD